MIDYVNKDLFLQNGIDKQWIITAYKKETIDGQETTTQIARMTNDSLLYDSISLSEAISSSDGLAFGRCEASRFEFTVYNEVTPLKKCELTVDIVLNHDEENPFRLGTYIVDSDKPTADRNHRKVIAYDRLSILSEKDIAPWYKSLLFPMTLKAFRDSFFEYVGITQETVSLPQDNINIKKTLDDKEELSAISILMSICEINGSFGHMSRDDIFKYIRLPLIVKGLYPSDTLYPADDLYPAGDEVSIRITKNHWLNAEYEDYECKAIDGVVIMDEENNIAAASRNDPENAYKLEGNFLTYELSSSELETIANNLYEVIKDRVYQPSKVECIANPCLEVGDSYIFNTAHDAVYTYVLSRSISGIQFMKDILESSGDEDRSKELNSISKQLARLKNKSEYDLEVTKARISILESDHVTTAQLDAERARIDELSAEQLIVSGQITAAEVRVNGNISAAEARVNGNINAVNANLSGRITAAEGSITSLSSDVATIKNAYITTATCQSIVNSTLVQAQHSPYEGTAYLGNVYCGNLYIHDGQTGTYKKVLVSKAT